MCKYSISDASCHHHHHVGVISQSMEQDVPPESTSTIIDDIDKIWDSYVYPTEMMVDKAQFCRELFDALVTLRSFKQWLWYTQTSKYEARVLKMHLYWKGLSQKQEIFTAWRTTTLESPLHRLRANARIRAAASFVSLKLRVKSMLYMWHMYAVYHRAVATRSYTLRHPEDFAESPFTVHKVSPQ